MYSTEFSAYVLRTCFHRDPMMLLLEHLNFHQVGVRLLRAIWPRSGTSLPAYLGYQSLSPSLSLNECYPYLPQTLLFGSSQSPLIHWDHPYLYGITSPDHISLHLLHYPRLLLCKSCRKMFLSPLK